MDALGSPDRARSRELGAASYALLYANASWLLDAGVGLVVESNFRRRLAEAQLRSLAARARAVLIHCQAPRDVVLGRYARRAASGVRHPGHHDDPSEVAHDLDAQEFEPLALGVTTLRVDTADGYLPALEEILAFIRAA